MTGADATDDLVKVHIDLTANPDSGGEAMWALPLGDDLHELRNVPFHAYELTFLDVVHAVPLAPDLKPRKATGRPMSALGPTSWWTALWSQCDGRRDHPLAAARCPRP